MEREDRLRRIEADAYRLRLDVARLSAGVEPLPPDAALLLDEFQTAADAVADRFPQVIDGSLSDDGVALMESAWKTMAAAADGFRASLSRGGPSGRSLSSD